VGGLAWQNTDKEAIKKSKIIVAGKIPATIIITKISSQTILRNIVTEPLHFSTSNQINFQVSPTMPM
jgi:hypothetical protein